MNALNWFQARGLAKEQKRAIRREGWKFWILFRFNLWIKSDLAEDGTEVRSVLTATDFRDSEFLAKDWTDLPWEGATTPPCTTLPPATDFGAGTGGLGTWTRGDRCGGAGEGGGVRPPLSEPEGTASGGPYELQTAGLGGTINVLPRLALYPAGTRVVLSAEPGADYTFDQWSGFSLDDAYLPRTDWIGSASATDNPLMLVIRGHTSVAAQFQARSGGSPSFFFEVIPCVQDTTSPNVPHTPLVPDNGACWLTAPTECKLVVVFYFLDSLSGRLLPVSNDLACYVSPTGADLSASQATPYIYLAEQWGLIGPVVPWNRPFHTTSLCGTDATVVRGAIYEHFPYAPGHTITLRVDEPNAAGLSERNHLFSFTFPPLCTETGAPVGGP